MSNDVDAVREFNRFYTRRFGLTRNGYANRSLAEARVLYELGANGITEVQDLKAALDIDAGQLSRVLATASIGLDHAEVPSAAATRADSRVELTASRASDAFEQIDAESADRRSPATLERLPDKHRVIDAMQAPPARDRARRHRRDPRPRARRPRLARASATASSTPASTTGTQSFERLVARHRRRASTRRRTAPGSPNDDGRARRRGPVRPSRRHRPAKLRTLLVEPSPSAVCASAAAWSARSSGTPSERLRHAHTLDQRHPHAARRIYEREGFTSSTKRLPRVRPRPRPSRPGRLT